MLLQKVALELGVFKNPSMASCHPSHKSLTPQNAHTALCDHLWFTCSIGFLSTPFSPWGRTQQQGKSLRLWEFQMEYNWQLILYQALAPFLNLFGGVVGGGEWQLGNDYLIIIWISLQWAVSCVQMSFSVIWVLFVTVQIQLKNNRFSLTSQ